jgi:hypothetical protein
MIYYIKYYYLGLAGLVTNVKLCYRGVDEKKHSDDQSLDL